MQSIKVLIDAETGLGKGFGFVRYMSHEEAAEAIKKFDGYDFQGTPLSVRFAFRCTQCAARVCVRMRERSLIVQGRVVSR